MVDMVTLLIWTTIAIRSGEERKSLVGDRSIERIALVDV